ncbi:hypothetical protein CROQUDRAFT_99919 [Cronartium quercuum f. sp. fusiforme G11]|uniref:Uncharacterized protein n=1 Tax=Cronartium quercuum f. sp. fusiforme G11 TaxID=708437 RepID=A0A9P6N6J2_9BASI|nr:hypothetical protein CROQUDRAFT_99919 [Cronartium quercuum f. sp. fusiforme G11]
MLYGYQHILYLASLYLLVLRPGLSRPHPSLTGDSPTGRTNLKTLLSISHTDLLNEYPITEPPKHTQSQYTNHNKRFGRTHGHEFRSGYPPTISYPPAGPPLLVASISAMGSPSGLPVSQGCYQQFAHSPPDSSDPAEQFRYPAPTFYQTPSPFSPLPAAPGFNYLPQALVIRPYPLPLFFLRQFQPHLPSTATITATSTPPPSSSIQTLAIASTFSSSSI